MYIKFLLFWVNYSIKSELHCFIEVTECRKLLHVLHQLSTHNVQPIRDHMGRQDVGFITSVHQFVGHDKDARVFHSYVHRWKPN